MWDREKILITAIKNPFDPYNSRIVKSVEPEGKTVFEHMQDIYPLVSEDLEVVASIDGRRVKEVTEIVHKGENLVFCIVPKSNENLRLIAMIIVMVVAFWVAGPAGGAAMNTAMGGAVGATTGFAYGLGFALAAGAVMYAGGAIVNAVLPIQQPGSDITSPDQNSPTYGWALANNRQEEGGAWPVLYGTVRITPPLINRYISTDTANKQHLNLQFAIADHAIDSVSSTEINDNAIAYFTEVVEESVLGTNNQLPLQNFMDTYTEKAVGTPLSFESWTTVEATGNATEGLVVALTVPNGLFVMSGSGTYDPAYLSVKIQYRISGGDWIEVTYPGGAAPAAWQEVRWYHPETRVSQGGKTYICFTSHISWADGDGAGTHSSSRGNKPGATWNNGAWKSFWHLEMDILITGAKSEALRKVYRIEHLVAGTYEARAYLSVDPPTGATYSNTIYFDYIQSIVYDDFSYPGASLLGVKILATDQLSGGMPRITTLATRSTVSVWTGSAWENKVATNPAWASYDMHVNRNYGGAVDHNRMIYQEFSDWADFCDTNGYTVNIYFDTFASFNEQVAKVSTEGRARVVQRGTSFGVIIDQEASPVQLFGIQNIVANSFENSYIGRKDRANVIEMSYFDADRSYTRQTFELRSVDFDPDENIEERKISIVLYGCTSKTQAEKYAQFLLNCNKYFLRMVTFEVGVDALASGVGDVVYVSHDVPQWGYSGRIISARPDTVQLDREVTMVSGSTYHILVRHSADDSLEEVEIENTEDTRSFLRLTGTWTTVPSAEDVYTFGKINVVAKQFRIGNISRAEEQTRRITALEYRSEVYDDDADIPAYESESDLPAVDELVVVERWTIQGAVGVAFANLSWRGFGFHTVYQKDEVNTTWKIIRDTRISSGSNDLNVYDLENDRIYTFSVTTSKSHPSQGRTAVLTFVGHPPTPIAPSNVVLSVADLGLILKWNANTRVWTKGYDIRIDTNTPVVYNYAGTSYLLSAYQEPGTYSFEVRTVDYFGQQSSWSAKSYDVVKPPATSSFTFQVIDNNVLLFWTAVTGGTFPIDEYEIRRGSVFSTATVIGTKKGTFTTVFESSSGSYKYWIVAIDLGRNYGTEKGLTATVSQPPDFVFNAQYELDFADGTPTNVFVEDSGTAYAPANVAETWEEHFVDNVWSNIQDAINAGHTYFLEPVPLTAQYYEETDYGTLLASSMITVDLDKINFNNGIIVSTKIATKGVSYTDQTSLQIFATSFQYVRDKFDITVVANTDFARLDLHTVRLDTKISGDAGTGTTGSDGTIKVYFNVKFIDVISINVTPKGTLPIYAVYDFDDITYPAAFIVYTFDSTGVAAPAIPFSWKAEGYSLGESLTTTTTSSSTTTTTTSP